MKGFFKDGKTIERMRQGPLGPFIGNYAEQLRSAGYATQSARLQLRLLADFSWWLAKKGIVARRIAVQHKAQFLQSRKRAGYRLTLGDRAALTRLFQLLREQGIPRNKPHAVAKSPSEILVQEYDRYLEKECVLTPATRINYRPFVLQFLVSKFGDGRVDLSALRAPDVLSFVRRSAERLKGKRVHLMITALRSFLRYARYRGAITLDLAACVPPVANWSLSTVPRSLPREQVDQVLAGCNRTTALGRRDYAILLLLARLGLRSGEVVRLTLDDIDWDHSDITIGGKMGRLDQLPLPLMWARQSQRI